MIVIADGGSTKTNWCLIDENHKRVNFNTEGYNPYFIDTSGIIKSLRAHLPEKLDYHKIEEVHFYGAGIHNQERILIVENALKAVFTDSKIFVGHDLLAAARALLGTASGFAAILGTGTNTCIYDGEKISYHIDSLGYFLGDEGSGSSIGKRLLRDYMRGLMPEELSKIFYNTYQLNSEDILDRLLNKPLPNRFLASFSKFIYDNNYFVEYARDVVKESFTAFFENLVSKYPGYQQYSFNCIGSVGYNFRDILREVATEYNMKIGKIIRSPIDDLVEYHISQKQPRALR